MKLLSNLWHNFRSRGNRDEAIVKSNALPSAQQERLIEFFNYYNAGTFVNVDLTDSEQAKSARVNSAVVACITELCIGYVEPRLRVYDGDGEDAKILPDNPARALIASPGNKDGEGEAEFANILQFYKAAGGNAYIYKLRNNAKYVVGLRAYSALEITPKKGAYGEVSHYEYRSGRFEFDIPPEDIIHLRWPGPRDAKNKLCAAPPIMSLADEIGSDKEALRFMHALLKNGAMPGFVLTVDPDAKIGKTARDEYKEYFRENFGGDRRGEPAVLPAGYKAQRVGMNFRDAAISQTLKVPESRIAAVYRVPPIVAGLTVGIDNSYNANYGVALKHFTERTLAPMWRSDAAQIEEGFYDEKMAGGSVFTRDLSLRHDLSQVKALEEARNANKDSVRQDWEKGLINRDEARTGLGREKVGGELGASYYGQNATQASNEDDGGDEEEDSEEQSAKSHKALTDAAKDAQFKFFDEPGQEHVQTLSDSVAGAYEALEKALLKSLAKQSTKKDATPGEIDIEGLFSFWDEEFFRAILGEAVTNEIEDLLNDMAGRSASNIGEEWDDLKTEFEKKIAKELAKQIDKVKGIDETVRKELLDLVTKNKASSVDDLKKKIKEKFTFYSGSRAKTTAQTVVTDSTGAMQDMVWTEQGFSRAWLTQRDGKVRIIPKKKINHRQMDGARPGEDGRYKMPNGRKTRHPAGDGLIAEDAINCRCTQAPVDDSGGKSIAYLCSPTTKSIESYEIN